MDKNSKNHLVDGKNKHIAYLAKELGIKENDDLWDRLYFRDYLIENPSVADEYAEFMKERAAPDYGSIDGLEKLYFLRRIDGDAAHFLLVTLWDSMESVKKFAGEHPEKAKYYPEDDAFLLEKEETSALYEVFFEK